MDNRSVNSERNDNCSHSVFNSGCGCNDASGIVITISPTTGGQFSLEVRKTDSIDHLKKIISKKLKVLRERICLLYRDRQLMNGSLQDNDLNDGSRLTLLPIVETGLTTQRPELSVMNALESLNESQVNDFLSGKAPLNLTMRLGDHMMLIQLMLSTFSNQSQASIATSKTDDQPSTSAAATSRSSRKSDSSPSETSFMKPAARAVNAATASTLSSTRLEKILSSRSAVTSAQETKPDLSNTNNEVFQVSQISASALRESRKKNSSAAEATACTSSCSSASCSCRSNPCPTTPVPGADSVPLAKATRNLTQTLQKLSSEVLTSKRVTPSHSKYKGNNDAVMHYSRKPNAILENMEHHGRGIYSGTFSGTLNPALQDRFGRPKKDVSTIIHILNDLLCAEPRAQCKSSCGCSSASVAEKMNTSSSSSLNADSHPISFVTSDSTFKNAVNDTSTCNPATVAPNAGSARNVNILNKRNENQTTRSKMEQLKSIMEERKEKRKEKRFSPYEKRFSAVNLISSSTVDAAEWSATAADAAVHATSANESIDADPSSSIHSKPVIA